jgi:hypothetical protein
MKRSNWLWQIVLLHVPVVIQLVAAASMVDYKVGNKYYFEGYYRSHGAAPTPCNFTQEVIGDTTINSRHYFILQRSPDFRILINENVPSHDTGTVFIERSDSTSLYRYDPSSPDDFLLVNFTDTVGTPYLQYGTLIYYNVSSKGDSVVLGQAQTTLRIVFWYQTGSSVNRPWTLFYSAQWGHSRYYTDYYDFSVDSRLVGAVIDGAVVGDTALADVLPSHKEGLPSFCELFQNYPNPFNPTTVVSYQLPAASLVRLVVYDLLGQEVAVLVNERKDPGNYQVKFDATGLASGVYLYGLTAGESVQTSKMVLVK